MSTLNDILNKIKKSVINPNENSFHNYPFGKKPSADRKTYLSIWEVAKSKEYLVVDDFEKETGFSIEKEWFNKLALITQVVKKKSEICYQHGRLLYSVLSQNFQNHRSNSINILESGTARGFSALCMAKALEDNNQSGKIVTIDPLPNNVSMFWNCISDLDGEKSRAKLLEKYSKLIEKYIWFIEGKSDQILNRLELNRVHFGFLDGSHNYDDVNFEIKYLIPRQKKGDMIFFDDFHETLYPGIVKAVKELESSGKYRLKIIRVNAQRSYAIGEKQI
ncbi:MAG: hypothetical protein CMG75_07780 [Candidatus Marinimicrobia bacterium]|nr:hypothetical protein [Candidatus Neomarinimicrobiota bacterium]|tara:strand:- start:6119 stop:6949 length:831 start_codon:yes stop_codon:yes gene_type:complete